VISSVGKVFKDMRGFAPTTEKDYFDECMTQMVAESFAQEFNRRLQPTSRLGKAAAARRAAVGWPYCLSHLNTSPPFSAELEHHGFNRRLQPTRRLGKAAAPLPDARRRAPQQGPYLPLSGST